MADLQKLYALHNDDEKLKEFMKSINELRILDQSRDQLNADRKDIVKYVVEKFGVKAKQVNKIVKIKNNPGTTIEEETEELGVLSDIVQKSEDL